MAFVNKKDDSSAPVTEYSVYIFHDPLKQDSCPANWEKKTTTKNKHRALAKAKKLHTSNDYQKVEVKKKLSDPRHGFTVDKTFKVFKKQQWKAGLETNATALYGPITAAITATAIALYMLIN